MKVIDKREHLRQLVSEKNRWSRPLTQEEEELGFLGWHERGQVPHCDFPGLTQFVTFRLADSMPSSRRAEWEHLLKIEDEREKRKKLEEYLDRGIGECQLRDSRVAKITEQALLHFHCSRYELAAWCVMPNHVHVLVNVWLLPLWKIVKSWKQHVATQANLVLAERRPPARRREERGDAPNPKQSLQWQREYWDTFMRSEKQQRTAVQYIEANPVKAHLCRAPEIWSYSSARFRDEFQRLAIPQGRSGKGGTSA